ncbi:RHS repeat-associated core domain-containing protein [Streptomyces sp. NPDC059720]|uniref:RHS repeat-associated core domain-containing protein n=1 Tax=Streptomyces sp. NPDC059720 TaxID=3346924 RepID=UPI0036BA1DC5
MCAGAAGGRDDRRNADARLETGWPSPRCPNSHYRGRQRGQHLRLQPARGAHPVPVLRTGRPALPFRGRLPGPTGLYHFQARYYDANIGRFTQPDPSGQEKNPYLYAEGDPVNRIDPNGTLSFGPVLDAISLGNDAATVGKAWNAAVDGDYGRAAGITFGLRRPAHFEEKP